MQIEAEKRALLKWVLLGVTALLVASLIGTGFMFRRYSTAENLIESANEKAANAENQLQRVSRELAEKKAILEKSSAALAKQDAAITSIVPKMLSKAATNVELAELAQAIHQQPGHMIEVPGVPPDAIFRRFYRARVDGKPHKYALVPGQIDDKQVVYSLLVKNQGD